MEVFSLMGKSLSLIHISVPVFNHACTVCNVAYGLKPQLSRIRTVSYTHLLSIQDIELEVLDAPGNDVDNIVIPAHTLYGDYPAKIPEPEIMPVAEMCIRDRPIPICTGMMILQWMKMKLQEYSQMRLQTQCFIFWGKEKALSLIHIFQGKADF